MVACKQLLPVFDKPMIYYPVSLLILQQVRDILLITNPEDVEPMRRLLGDGSRFGVRFQYIVQDSPRGIAEGIILAEEFLDGAPFCYVLGDNVLFGQTVPTDLAMGAKSAVDDGVAGVYGYRVSDPENFGVITFRPDGTIADIVEKPKVPPSNWASIGVYMFPGDAPAFARRVTPSARGELEIPEVHKLYLAEDRLRGFRLGRGTAWLDTGTPASLMEAGNFLHAIEKRQGLKVYCPEEVAFRAGLLTEAQLRAQLPEIPSKDYRDYLERVLLDR
jgi:glucose-1-phosphate thymidylyltransferase